jgi:hypothetical protein
MTAILKAPIVFVATMVLSRSVTAMLRRIPGVTRRLWRAKV